MHAAKPEVVEQATKLPTRKMTAGGLAAAVITVIVGILEAVGIEVDGTLAASAVTVLAFVLAYFVKDRDNTP